MQGNVSGGNGVAALSSVMPASCGLNVGSDAVVSSNSFVCYARNLDMYITFDFTFFSLT